MTVVVADSSPLNYLTLIGSVDVLRGLYGTVVVPQQVITELIDLLARRPAVARYEDVDAHHRRDLQSPGGSDCACRRNAGSPF